MYLSLKRKGGSIIKSSLLPYFKHVWGGCTLSHLLRQTNAYILHRQARSQVTLYDPNGALCWREERTLNE